MDEGAETVCPLCLRPIPRGAKKSLHHLVPKLKGGKGGPVVLLHQICHNEIHARFSESKLARDLNTIDKLRSHRDMAGLLIWVAKRPLEFPSRNAAGRRKR